MKSKLILVLLTLSFLTTNVLYSQFLKNDSKINLKKDLLYNPEIISSKNSKVALGIGAGFAFYSNKTGVAISMFSEIFLDNFSFVPQADYWKVEDKSNFEMAGLARLYFPMTNMKPYVDGGIGINFYDDKEKNESFTKLGLDVGAGLDFQGVFENANIFVDAKYKIIISETGNIYGYTLIGGIKFPL